MNSIARFCYNLWRNNNTRSWLFLITAILLLIATIVIFGFGSVNEPSSSETAQKYYNLIKHGQFITDSEFAGLWGSIKNFFDWWWSVLAWIAYTFSFAYLAFAIVYWFVARRDEVGRAWDSAHRRLHEKTEGGKDIPDVEDEKKQEQKKESVTKPILNRFKTLLSFLVVELFGEFIGKKFGRRNAPHL